MNELLVLHLGPPRDRTPSPAPHVAKRQLTEPDYQDLSNGDFRLDPSTGTPKRRGGGSGFARSDPRY